MAILCLVRHASHSLLGSTLAGRVVDVELNHPGWEETKVLGDLLETEPITHIQSSPRLRAMQTAGAIARRIGRRVTIIPALDEVDFGSWAGRRFAELDADPHWLRWNSERSGVRAPGGEAIEDVLHRVSSHIRNFAEANPRGYAVMVTHAEVIRALVLTWMKWPLRDWADVDVPPGSATRWIIGGEGCVEPSLEMELLP